MLYRLYVYYMVHICDFGMLRVNVVHTVHLFTYRMVSCYIHNLQKMVHQKLREESLALQACTLGGGGGVYITSYTPPPPPSIWVLFIACLSGKDGLIETHIDIEDVIQSYI